MSIWGKIIGGAAGFALGGPLGAILGVAAGHAIDRNLPGKGAAGADTAQAAITVALIVLAAKLAKADGHVTRDEVDAFKRLFHIPPEESRNVARIFDAAKKDATGFEPYAAQVAGFFRRSPAVLEELLDALFHIARADGDVSPSEIAYLREVARIFGLGEREFERVSAASDAAQKSDPYGVLGLDRSASDDDIKKTYRRLIRENHPDKLIAEGMPDDFIELANERMATINAAYDQIEKERRL